MMMIINDNEIATSLKLLAMAGFGIPYSHRGFFNTPLYRNGIN